MNQRHILLLSSFFALVSLAHSREWTANDGRKLEADFVSADATSVIVKRAADGKSFTLPLGGISEADRAWIKEEQAKSAKPVTGAYALDLIKELPIDENRAYVVGYSMGGFGACHFAVTEPKRFAAVVAGAGCTGPSSADVFKRLPYLSPS